MSPTVFRHRSWRFYFFSREEQRMHIHVASPRGEAKFWLEPTVSLAICYGLPERALRELEKIIEERKDEIKKAWRKHFKS